MLVNLRDICAIAEQNNMARSAKLVLEFLYKLWSRQYVTSRA